jgi:hypothetical protein
VGREQPPPEKLVLIKSGGPAATDKNLLLLPVYSSSRFGILLVCALGGANFKLPPPISTQFFFSHHLHLEANKKAFAPWPKPWSKDRVFPPFTST